MSCIILFEPRCISVLNQPSLHPTSRTILTAIVYLNINMDNICIVIVKSDHCIQDASHRGWQITIGLLKERLC